MWGLNKVQSDRPSEGIYYAEITPWASHYMWFHWTLYDKLTMSIWKWEYKWWATLYQKILKYQRRLNFNTLYTYLFFALMTVFVNMSFTHINCVEVIFTQTAKKPGIRKAWISLREIKCHWMHRELKKYYGTRFKLIK